jgi:hypothetical protein
MAKMTALDASTVGTATLLVLMRLQRLSWGAGSSWCQSKIESESLMMGGERCSQEQEEAMGLDTTEDMAKG